MCLSVGWLEHILIWLVCIAAVVGILQLLIPWVFASLGVNLGPVPAIIRIVLFAIIAIAVIVFAFDMIGCLMPRF